MFIPSKEDEKINRVKEAIQAIKRGEIVILTDYADRENEGDLCFAAEHITPEHINFMAKYGRGLICLTLTEKQVKKLGLKMMVSENESAYNTAFTVSIEAAHGVSTGISAEDRAKTVKVAIAEDATPASLISPGHMFPLKARNGGVLARTGQTEGSVDLARLAGLKPAGVICEIMNDDGSMAREKDLEIFAKKYGLVKVSIDDLIAYRLRFEPLINLELSKNIEISVLGSKKSFDAYVYTTPVDQVQFLALKYGDFTVDEAVPIRMHHGCLIPEILDIEGNNSVNTNQSLQYICEYGKGIFVYIKSPYDHLKNMLDLDKQEEKTTYERENVKHQNFGLGAQVLKNLGVGKIKLISDSDIVFSGLKPFGLEIVDRIGRNDF